MQTLEQPLMYIRYLLEEDDETRDAEGCVFDWWWDLPFGEGITDTRWLLQPGHRVCQLSSMPEEVHLLVPADPEPAR